MLVVGEPSLVGLDRVVQQVAPSDFGIVLANEVGDDGELVQRAPAGVRAGREARAQKRQHLGRDEAAARVQPRQHVEAVVPRGRSG